MSEPIKISENELAEIKMLQDKFQEKTFSMGLLYLEKMQVDEIIKNLTKKEQDLQDEWNNLKNMENGLIDKLIKVYGEGYLDLNKGLFVPEKK
jgi:hypothetical protein